MAGSLGGYSGANGQVAATADMKWRKDLRPRGKTGREVRRVLDEDDVPVYMRHTQVSVNKDKTVVGRKGCGVQKVRKQPKRETQGIVSSWEKLREMQEGVINLEKKVIEARAQREARLDSIFGPRSSVHHSPSRQYSRLSLQPRPIVNGGYDDTTETDTPSKSVTF